MCKSEKSDVSESGENSVKQLARKFPQEKENCAIISSSTRPFCSVCCLISRIVRCEIFNPPATSDKRQKKGLLKHNQTYMSGSFMLCAVRKSIKAAEIFIIFRRSFSRCLMVMLSRRLGKFNPFIAFDFLLNITKASSAPNENGL